RDARVAALRGEDPGLADELAKLIAADSRGEVLDHAAAAAVAALETVGVGTPSRPGIPASLGKYTILRVLGEGGMGVVSEAEQEAPRRKVAVKVIRTALATPVLRKRFLIESHILGRLNH